MIVTLTLTTLIPCRYHLMLINNPIINVDYTTSMNKDYDDDDDDDVAPLL